MVNKSSSDIESQIKRGVFVLKQGGIVAYPTDTVYGLGASARIPEAVERIYQVKGRLKDVALPLLVADEEQMKGLADLLTPIARLFIQKFLPGALTIVLPKSRSVPDYITAGGKTVGVRIPAHPIPIALIRGLGAPIVGTSANLSGKPSALTADEVHSQLGDKVDLVIDGGRCPGGKESTVIDLTGISPVILREGAISRETLEKACNCVVLIKGG